MPRKAAPKKAKKRPPAKKAAKAPSTPKKRKRELTAKQQRFVDEYLVDLDATKAAKRAGYSQKSASVLGYQLLQNPLVTAALAKKGAAQQERTQITADTVLGEFLRIARCDIGQAFDAEGRLKPLQEIPEDVRRAISAIETSELYDGSGNDRVRIGQVRKVKFWDKNRSLEALARHLGLLRDRVENFNIDLTALSDEQLAALARGEDPIAVLASAPGVR